MFRGSKRDITGFYKRPLPSSTLGSASRQEEILSYQSKVVREGDNEHKDKYKAGHYIKEFFTSNSLPGGVHTSFHEAKKYAEHEVAAMEFMRLMIEWQPKVRLMADQDKYWVRCKEIDNAQSLSALDNDREFSLVLEIQKKASVEQYGSSTGYKGLGELNFVMFGLLQDDHHVGRNYLCDSNNRLHRIHCKETKFKSSNFGKTYKAFEEFLYSEELSKQNPVYIRERNQALLKFLTLPAEILLAFCNRYFSDEAERAKNSNYLLQAQDNIKRNLIEDCQTHLQQSRLFVNLFPEFTTYVTSHEARIFLCHYAFYLKQFTLSGKDFLIDQDTNWEDIIAAHHQQLIDELVHLNIVACPPAQESLTNLKPFLLPTSQILNIQEPRYVANSSSKDLRPVTCSRDLENLHNAQHDGTERDRSESHEKVARRRDSNTPQPPVKSAKLRPKQDPVALPMFTSVSTQTEEKPDCRILLAGIQKLANYAQTLTGNKKNQAERLAQQLEHTVNEFLCDHLDRAMASQQINDLICKGRQTMRQDRTAFDILAHIAIACTVVGFVVMLINKISHDTLFLTKTSRERHLEAIENSFSISLQGIK